MEGCDGGNCVLQVGEDPRRLDFADVTALAEFGGGHSVAVSPGAFAWLKDAYGPHAREGPVCDAYRAAAMSGVELALRHIAGHPGIPEARVVIDRINVPRPTPRPTTSNTLPCSRCGGRSGWTAAFSPRCHASTPNQAEAAATC